MVTPQTYIFTFIIWHNICESNWKHRLLERKKGHTQGHSFDVIFILCIARKALAESALTGKPNSNSPYGLFYNRLKNE